MSLFHLRIDLQSLRMFEGWVDERQLGNAPPKRANIFWYGSHTVYRYLHNFTCIHIDISYIIICIHVYIYTHICNYVYAIMYICIIRETIPLKLSSVLEISEFQMPPFRATTMAQGNLDWDPHGVFEVHSLGPCGRSAGPGPVGVVIRTPQIRVLMNPFLRLLYLRAWNSTRYNMIQPDEWKI